MITIICVIIAVVIVAAIIYFTKPYVEVVQDNQITQKQIEIITNILLVRRIEPEAFIDLCKRKFYKDHIGWLVSMEDLTEVEAQKFIDAYKLK